MKALSGLDASFLYLETARMPMHIGSIAIVEGSINFDEFKAYIGQRLHKVERLQQKVVFVPLGLDRPYWVQDPDFDLDRHLFCTALPKPGRWQDLRHLASQEFSIQLSRERPLWEFIFVEGLDNIPQVPKGSVALLSKIHHAGFDGKAGIELMNMLYNPSADISETPVLADTPIEATPSGLKLLSNSVRQLILRPSNLPRLILSSAQSVFKAGYLRQIKHIRPPTLPFTAPDTFLSDTVSVERNWDCTILDLARIKALRILVDGATLNDVVLTICAGALRRYLLDKKQLPEESLVAMVPISTRTTDNDDPMGNQVSMMFIQLATNVKDPLKRLQKIQLNTLVGKLYQEVVAANSFMSYAELVPFGLAAMATRFYSQLRLAKLIPPPFNVIITNVPGPQKPFYLAGHKLLFNMGMGPIYDGVGLIIPVLSYNSTLTISPTSCAKLMPDIELFCGYIRESVDELEMIAVNKRQTNTLLAPEHT
jgi:WS/DGAT/MGAT family acyltransferase